MISIDIREQIIIGNIQNLILYYRGNEMGDKVTYMHTLRRYRKSLLELISIIKESKYYSERFLLLRDLSKAIKSDVSSDDCECTINRLAEILYEYNETEKKAATASQE